MIIKLKTCSEPLVLELCSTIKTNWMSLYGIIPNYFPKERIKTEDFVVDLRSLEADKVLAGLNHEAISYTVLDGRWLVISSGTTAEPIQLFSQV